MGKFKIDLQPDPEGNGDLHGDFVDAATLPCDISELSEDESGEPGDKLLALGRFNALMFLDRSMSAALWPLLKRHAENGSLAEPTPHA